MKIKLYEIPVKDIVKGYLNSDEEGIVGYDGKLNIRPQYQREFVYKDKQRDAVINTVQNDFPLNVMYWVKNDDDTYEVLDGQQRTISICEYVDGVYSIAKKYFHNLTKVEQNQILNYKLMIYFCEGTDKERLDWFRTINIAGEKLTEQELRNAVYTGPWLTDAKRYFSKTGCAAYNLGNDYIKGVCIRQEFLETVLKWISDRDGEAIEDYMAKHQHDKNANDLWLYFSSVINWVKTIFPKYRKEMKGIEWGILYNKYHKNEYDAIFLDIEMPEMDGITVAKNLRKLHSDVPIIFLTSHIEYALEGYEVNALRYLTKPISPEKLKEVLSCVMERAKKQRILWIEKRE